MIPAEGLSVIDNPAQVEHLIAKLRAALPLSATVSPSMLAQLQEQAPGLELSPQCQITGIHYAGDDGGILCRRDFGTKDAVGLPPWCGGVRSDYHAAARMVIASMLARASTGVR